MTFKKGEPRPVRAGRKKGAKNQNTTALKEMILQALDESGGIGYLKRQAEENATAFLTLVGKVLPMTVAGDPNAPIKTDHTIEIIHVKP